MVWIHGSARRASVFSDSGKGRQLCWQYETKRYICIWKVNYYTPDIRSMWGYIVFAFPLVRSYVRSFVCPCVLSFIFQSQGQSFCVKVYKTSILKTLWWISFIFGMMVDIGLKFLLAPSPPRGWPLGQGHRLPIFIKMFFWRKNVHNTG